MVDIGYGYRFGAKISPPRDVCLDNVLDRTMPVNVKLVIFFSLHLTIVTQHQREPFVFSHEL